MKKKKASVTFNQTDKSMGVRLHLCPAIFEFAKIVVLLLPDMDKTWYD